MEFLKAGLRFGICSRRRHDPENKTTADDASSGQLTTAAERAFRREGEETVNAHRGFRALVVSAALLVACSASAQTYTVLHDFSAGAGHPQAPLIQIEDGSLWGTSFDGGAYGGGSIFSMTPDGFGGFTFTDRYAFMDGNDGHNPTAGLVQAADGRLYGATSTTLFRIDSDGNNFQTVHTFALSEGLLVASALIAGSDGLLYGAAPNFGPSNYGTLFSFDPGSEALTVLHDFDNTHGGNPYGSLLEGADGRLYGTTAGGGDNFAGTVFVIDKTGKNFAVLHHCSFGDGGYPRAALIQLADGFLYGTTTNVGSVFRIETNGDNFEVLHALMPGEGTYPVGALVLASDGLLYGTAGDVSVPGTIYRLTSAGGSFEVVHTFVATEGTLPLAGLLRSADDSLFGTASNAADGGNGSVFQFDPVGGDVTVLHSFVCPDAFNSLASLLTGPGGFLYGTTAQGGPYGFGTVFKIDPSGTSYGILHGFAGSDGGGATAALIAGSDGKLYGTTTYGSSSAGNVFRIDPDGGNFEIIHSFDGADGNQAYGGVIQASDGKLYGGTYLGGLTGSGVIYRVDTDGGNYEVIHEFPFSQFGGGTEGVLLQASDGKLYGTTVHGGALDHGTIFRLDTDGGNFETIHEFAGPEGRFPTAGLIQSESGKLYGTGAQGGYSGDWGTVFALDPSGTGFVVLHRFNIFDGGYPYGPLLEAADGSLYGASVDGSIYRINPSQTPAFSNYWGANFALLHTFDYFTGAAPYGGLIQDADGNLYGTTNQGGAFLGGVVYKLELAPAMKIRKPRASVDR